MGFVSLEALSNWLTIHQYISKDCGSSLFDLSSQFLVLYNYLRSLKDLSHQKFSWFIWKKIAQDHNAHGPNLDKPCFHPQNHFFLHHPRAGCHWDSVTVSITRHWELVTESKTRHWEMVTVSKTSHWEMVTVSNTRHWKTVTQLKTALFWQVQLSQRWMKIWNVNNDFCFRFYLIIHG